MGPMNVALVKLFQADQRLREAQGRLEAVSRNVRVQQRKVNEISEHKRLATPSSWSTSLRHPKSIST